MIIRSEDKDVVSILSREEAGDLLLALFSDESDLPKMSQAAFVAYTVIKERQALREAKQQGSF